MGMQAETQREVQNALVTLMRAELVNWSVLEQMTLCLSRRGLGRPQIVDFFWIVMARYKDVLSSQDLDMLGDFNLHLVGQCNPRDTIRLVNDPDDLDALARTVSAAMRGWTPPHGIE
jgi:hypothetical protein